MTQGSKSSYVLVTPVRNEEKYVEATLRSVSAQSIPPKQWVIVSDGSTDRTDALVRSYADRFPWITFLRLEDRPERNFGSRVQVTMVGVRALTTPDYEFLGLLDGDIELPENYYEWMMGKFAEQPALGLGGGTLIEYIGGEWIRYRCHPNSVPGGIQFYRRESFEGLGGLTEMREGGFDAVAEVACRMNGWETRSFRDSEVRHLKPMNAAQGGSLRRKWQMGKRDYHLGNHPLFEILKCVYRGIEKPYIVSAALRMGGYFWHWLRRGPRSVPKDVMVFMRAEQLSRILPFYPAPRSKTPRGQAAQ